MTFVLLPLAQLQAASLTPFGDYDKDHNGRLNRAEYDGTQYPAELFEAADRNQDAVLSTAEFEQLIESLNEAQTRPGSGPHPPQG